MEITADIQDAIAGSLNSKCMICTFHVNLQWGELLKNWVRQIYIYTQRRTDMLQIMQCLRNKYIENFTNQYNQLMGYLNPNFEFGITLSMNREMSLKKGFDEIENKLKSIKGDFQPIRIQRIGERDTLMITSEHIVPETGNRMKVFHMIFQLNDKERKEAAASARKR